MNNATPNRRNSGLLNEISRATPNQVKQTLSFIESIPLAVKPIFRIEVTQ